MRRALKIGGWFFLGLVGLFVVRGCIPSSYDTPRLSPRASTQFWSLPTGSTIAYTKLEGSDGGTPIIALHGGPGGYVHSRDIETLGALADAGFDVYLYDQIGSGLSARLENIRDYTAGRCSLGRSSRPTRRQTRA